VELAAVLDAVQRRLGDIKMSALDYLLHVTEEKSQQKRPDVEPVHVGVGHDHDLVVACLFDIKLLAPNPRPDRGDYRLYLLVGQDLVQARFFHVEDLSLQRQYRLEVAIAPLLGGATRGIALHEVKLTERGILLRTVGEFPRQRVVLQRALSTGKVLRLFCRDARLGALYAFIEYFPYDLRILVEELAQVFVHHRLHYTLHLAVAQFHLRLALELRVRELHADDGGEPLAHVVPGELRHLLVITLLFQEVVQHARKRRSETDHVRAALFGVNIVRVGVDHLVVRIDILEGDLHFDAAALLVESDYTLRDRVLVLVKMLYEGGDTALELEHALLTLAPVVPQDYPDTRIEKRKLPHSFCKDLETELVCLENLVIRQKHHTGTCLLRLTR